MQLWFCGHVLGKGGETFKEGGGWGLRDSGFWGIVFVLITFVINPFSFVFRACLFCAQNRGAKFFSRRTQAGLAPRAFMV